VIARPDREDRVAGRRVIEQPFAELADGLVAHGGECVAVQRVVDHARHFVAIVGNDRVLAQVVQGQIGEHGLGCYSFPLGARGDSRNLVARARFVGAGEQFLDRAEPVRSAKQSRREFHWRSGFDAGASCGHGDNLTRRNDKWKRCARKHYRERRARF
jgi:hypothetical protein